MAAKNTVLGGVGASVCGGNAIAGGGICGGNTSRDVGNRGIIGTTACTGNNGATAAAACTDPSRPLFVPAPGATATAPDAAADPGIGGAAPGIGGALGPPCVDAGLLLPSVTLTLCGGGGGGGWLMSNV